MFLVRGLEGIPGPNTAAFLPLLSTKKLTDGPTLSLPGDHSETLRN